MEGKFKWNSICNKSSASSEMHSFKNVFYPTYEDEIVTLNLTMITDEDESVRLSYYISQHVLAQNEADNN